MRNTGIGVLVFGVILTVVGAIMAFAVQVETEGFNMNKGGLILFWAGIATIVVSFIVMFVSGRSVSTSQSSIQQTPSGQVRTEERVNSL